MLCTAFNMMVYRLTTLLLLLILFSSTSFTLLNLRLEKRHGRLATNQPANLTRLSELLKATEDRYARTYRVPQDNRLVRQWTAGSEEVEDEHLFEDIGQSGAW
jgi:hypothetical protein